MKKVLYLIFLFALSIVIFSIFIISCEKSQLDSSPAVLSNRSLQPNYVAELRNNCGPELYPNQYVCYEDPYTSEPISIETGSGCMVEATMTIQKCDDVTDDVTVLFMSELSWDFVDPVSNECFNWINNLKNLPTALSNNAIDVFKNEIENAFIELFMLDWAMNAGGVGPRNVSTAYFEAACLQRCVDWDPSNKDYFNIIDQPCSENGCCMKLFSIEVPPADTVYNWGAVRLAPCSNFFPVQCRIGETWGECEDKICN